MTRQHLKSSLEYFYGEVQEVKLRHRGCTAIVTFTDSVSAEWAVSHPHYFSEAVGIEWTLRATSTRGAEESAALGRVKELEKTVAELRNSGADDAGV